MGVDVWHSYLLAEIQEMLVGRGHRRMNHLYTTHRKAVLMDNLSKGGLIDLLVFGGREPCTNGMDWVVL